MPSPRSSATGLTGVDVASYASEETIALGKDLHLLLPDGVGRSKLAADIGRQASSVGTMRSWRTVTRLLAMADEAVG